MPMSNPSGGGVTSLKALTDVAINNEDFGIDGAALQFSATSGKWSASLALATIPTVSTWNPADKSAGIALSNGNLTATRTAGNSGVRGNTARASGKYYLEFTIVQTSDAWTKVGFADAAYVLGSGVSNNNDYVLLGNTGAVSWNDIQRGNASAYAAGNVVGAALDFGNNAVWFRTGAGIWNNGAGNNPATNTGGFVITAVTANSLFPYFAADTTNDAVTLNTGGTAFANAVPSGFLPWDIFAPQVSTVGASPAAITAFTTGMFAVSGGTVTAITLTRGTSAAINLGSLGGVYSVCQGDILTVTYTAAPTVTFIPLAD